MVAAHANRQDLPLIIDTHRQRQNCAAPRRQEPVEIYKPIFFVPAIGAVPERSLISADHVSPVVDVQSLAELSGHYGIDRLHPFLLCPDEGTGSGWAAGGANHFAPVIDASPLTVLESGKDP